MQLTFLGTAAANAYPEAFCGCANCEQARALGGPSLRKRSAALVNDDLLIDLGPDIHTAAALHGRPLTNVRYCLQTHAHADHLDPSHLLSRSPAYGVVGAPRLQLYASPATLGRLAEALARDLTPSSLFDPAVQEQLNLHLHPVAPLAPFSVGPYTVLAIPANHDPSVEPLLYVVQAAGRCILYGTDTAALPESAWQALHAHILRQGNHWPEVYVFSYITEGSFDGYMWQGVESKARFIEQALAGEITARTAEDTSDVVLSAAEIKAIASGNPQIVRKVQLEAEVARLERVRGVWLDTRRNLQLERHFTEEEIRRAESRRQLWEQAAAIVAAHPHEPFCAEVAASAGSDQFSPITNRAEAGAAVRRLMHDYQSAAAFQRKRLRGVVARYRGLDLVVRAHAVFAADLTLALPGGATLDTVTAATDTGVWQSASRTLGQIPSVLERLHGRIAESHERIATIDRELVRLEAWDGQTTYDAAVSELSAINAVFAAAEEQADTEPSATATPATEGTTRPAAATPPDASSLADLLLALAQEERASDNWWDWTTVIPPSPASLAWMAAEIERQPVRAQLRPEPLGVEAPEAEEVPMLAQEVGRLPAMGSGQAQFGNPTSQRRSPKPQAPTAPNGEAEVTQLSLF